MERRLWDEGIDSWSLALENLKALSFGTANKDLVQKVLERSIEALENKEHQFFANALGLKESWRCWPNFSRTCCFLDIETDGGRSGQSITVIGGYDGLNFSAFVKNDNLGNFPDYISKFSMIVTFFGATFDVPTIQKKFRNLVIDQIHIDLCPVLRSVGIGGGLKKIEKQLGVQRGEDTDGLTGYDAVRLWRRYEQFRDQKALRTLIAYNREDVVNLEVLAQAAFDLKLKALMEPESPEHAVEAKA